MDVKRLTKSLPQKENSTNFQIYLGSMKKYSQCLTHDFTQIKLSKLIEQNPNNQELIQLYKNYIEGIAVVAWRSGLPVFVKVTKDR